MDNGRAILVLSAAATWNGCGRATSDELQEAKMLAYKALEKQMPLSPIAKQHPNLATMSYYCVCGKQQRVTNSNRRNKDGWYCERCGQKLAWWGEKISQKSQKSVLE